MQTSKAVCTSGRALGAAAVLLLFISPVNTVAESPWLYGIHWYGDPAAANVETMTGGKGIWSLETVLTNSDFWWGPVWQRDNRFHTAVTRGHTLIVRVQRNWGENIPFTQNLTQYLVDVQTAAQQLANVAHIWQVGNEQNILEEWGGQVLSPAEYVQQYRQIRNALRAVPSPLGPQIVLLGPVSPGGVIPGVRHMDGNEYLAAMCDLLTPDEVDGFAIHAYAAPWNDATISRGELQAGYISQLAVIRSRGFGDKPVYLTEWNRGVNVGNAASEAASAQFLHGAFADLHAWNQTAGAHPIVTANWFIYPYDAGTWAQYSIEYLRTIGPPGPNNDLWDAFQYACTLNYPAGSSTPLYTPAMLPGMPTGQNISGSAVAVATDSGDGMKAIDGVISSASRWISNSLPVPHWLRLDLGRPRVLNGFVVYHTSATGDSPVFDTEAFMFQTADSPLGPWQIHTMEYNRPAQASTARTFVTPVTARFVRLVITDAGLDNLTRIAEFEVYATNPPGDYNGDGTVNAADLGLLFFCLRSPDTPYIPGHFCLAGDTDGDHDVDLADFAVIQVIYDLP